jgi:hypothetical protein
MSIASFAAGFVSGWIVRSGVESSRSLAVELGAQSQAIGHRLWRVLQAIGCGRGASPQPITSTVA